MKTALVLQGGGYKGIYQYGVLKTMKRQYDDIYGTSVGALNALYVASNYSKCIEDIWDNVVNSDFRFHSKKWYNIPLIIAGRRLGMYNNNLSKEIEKIIEKIKEINPFYVTTVDYLSGNIYYVKLSKKNNNYVEEWYKRNGQLDGTSTIKDSNAKRFGEIITASTSVPGAFEPIKIDGKLLYDGGVRDIAPLNGAVINGADTITLILCSPGEPRRIDKIENTLRAITRTIDILTNEVANEDVRKFLEYNEIAERYPEFNEKLKKIDLTIFKPEFSLLSDSLNPDKESLITALKMGINHGKDAGLENVRKHRMNDK